MESGSASEEAKAAVLPTRPRPDGLGANGLGATPAPASAGFNGVDMGSGTGASNAAWAGPGAAALAAGSDELIPAASAPSSRGAADVDARLAALPGVELVTGAFFNEFTVKLPKPAAPIVDALAAKGVIAGVPASRLLPRDASAANLLVVAATETNTDEDFDALVSALKDALS